MTQIKATLRYLHIAPRKVRLVAQVVRGMQAKRALNELAGLSKRASLPLQKLLESGIANAEHNFALKEQDLYVSELRVNGAPMQKRTFPRSRGRADIKRKRMSHITLVLTDQRLTTDDLRQSFVVSRKS
ncbi:MAG: 50S ribosomal protein L22 [Candidatus Portnoybacteria bacterium]|nr:50S ribosomal protein L22 [Candidatus Portnoybacteria bacterium]